MGDCLYINLKKISGKFYVFLLILLFMIVVGNISIRNYIYIDEIVNILLNIILIVTSFLLFFLYYNAFMRRIILRAEGITYKTPFNKSFILWTDIQSVGAFKQFRNSVEYIPFEEVGKKHVLGSIFIYCSRLPHERVITQNQKDTTIVFPYNPLILQEMEQYFNIKNYIK